MSILYSHPVEDAETKENASLYGALRETGENKRVVRYPHNQQNWNHYLQVE